MRSLITNCNSNNQLLQLVSIQLLQKAYFRQLMFEGANYFTIYSFLLVLVAVQFLYGNSRVLQQSCGQRGTNSRKQFMEQCSQCHKLPEPVHNRLTTSSLGYCCRVQQLATEACCQPPVCCCPIGATGCYFCSSITGFRPKTFSVCGLLTKGTPNHVERGYK